MGLFLFFEIRVLSAFFRKKRVFSAQEGILFFTHSPGVRTNRPKWTKFGQKLSFRNLPMSFFLFFEIRVLSAFFSKKRLKKRFFGVWEVCHVGCQKTIEFNKESKFLYENDFFPILSPIKALFPPKNWSLKNAFF